MKLIAMFGAAALAAGTLVAAAPADAQRHGWDRGGDRGWHQDGRGRDRGHGWDRGGRGWDRGRHFGYDRGRGYGYGYGRGYGRSRVVCRVHRGYYGPERRCFRVYR
jgi:hypothetical protein